MAAGASKLTISGDMHQPLSAHLGWLYSEGKDLDLDLDLDLDQPVEDHVHVQVQVHVHV